MTAEGSRASRTFHAVGAEPKAFQHLVLGREKIWNLEDPQDFGGLARSLLNVHGSFQTRVGCAQRFPDWLWSFAVVPGPLVFIG
jgi:hypothetical protein